MTLRKFVQTPYYITGHHQHQRMGSLIRGLPHLSPFDVAPFLETILENRYREKGFPQTGSGKV